MLLPLIASAACPSAARAQCTIWSLVREENPLLHHGSPTNMVFDVAAGECRMLIPSSPQGGFWQWNGERWARFQTWQPGGSATLNPAVMAYDTIRQRTVVLEQDAWTQRTWELVGNALLRHDVPGPSPRSKFAMCFDPTRGRVVLFGGDSNVTTGPDPLGDTWEWDGERWLLVSTQGPPARLNHGMVFDTARSRTLLFGGQGPSGALLNDTWEWDGQAWVHVASTGPEPRSELSMSYDSARGRTVLFGGYSAAAPFPALHLADTWEWDGSVWTRVSLTGPDLRGNGLMAFDPLRARTVLYGGWTRDAQLSGRMQYTWEWDGAQWMQRGPTEPQRREDHAMTYDSLRGEVVLFGGTQIGAVDARTTWAWNGETWTRRSEAGPSPRTSHAMAYDAARDRVVLFGGRQTGNPLILGDTWEWDGAAWTQRQGPSPTPRLGHKMVYDHARERVVLFGGSSGASLFGDTWEWDGQSWMPVTAPGPAATAGHAMTYDAARERTVLFTTASTWEFDGLAWHLAAATPTAMSGRTNPAFAYDAARQRCVLYGGGPGDTSIFEWDGAAWSMLAQQTNLNRQAAPMVFDEARERFVLFGGSGRGETWELPSSPGGFRFDAHPLGRTIQPGQTASFSVAVSGAGPFAYEWRRHLSQRVVTDGPGGASEGGGVVSGANSPTLTITGVQPSDTHPTDGFHCRVTNACGTLISGAASLHLFRCWSADFDNDGAPGTDADIEAFFACLAGSCCPTCATADFNNDGDTATDADIEAFFRVLAGGTC